MSRHIRHLLFVGSLCCPALGQSVSVIYQHNPDYNYPVGYYYDINLAGDITIHHAIENEVFEFESVRWNGINYDGPGDINTISVEGFPEAEVRITVLPNINAGYGQPFGAASIGQLSLVTAGYFNHVEGLSISGTLGTLPDSENFADSIDAPFSVADVGRPLNVQQGLFDTLTITGPGPHLAKLDIMKFEASAHVVINGSMLGDIEIGNPL